MIKLHSLNKYYNKNRSNEIHVLNNVSLELPDKGMVAVFGRSGCGKTTLLNAIGGLDKINSGEIIIDGENISENTDVLRNKRMGYIFQNYNLNTLENCYENVADALRLCGISDPETINKRTLAALRNVGMENYKSRTPDTLSGGQMQRIAIARAIVKNPHVILADEPTGNLDEANTVMIMDLLKQLSESHLVILVTHEANLVDHYCDRVIEIADGKIAGERINKNASGYSAKSKNDIYLGELEKTSLEDQNISIDCYSDCECPKIKLRIVNHGGKSYISIDTSGVQILDETSEVKLREGVYVPEKEKNELSCNIDMSDLPPIEGKYFGRLFTLKSSLKSGFEAIRSKKKKKSSNLMRICMLLFSIVIVFVTSLQGTVFKQYLDAKSNYNENVFYVYSPTYEVGDKLISALGSHGIDYTCIFPYTNIGDRQLNFSPGNFETYSSGGFSSGIKSNAAILPHSLCTEMKTVAGSSEYPGDSEMIITTATANKILETSSFSFVKSYADIIGFVCRTNYLQGSFTIKGIVESDETSAYVNNKNIEHIAFRQLGENIAKGSDFGIDIKNGETVFYCGDANNLTEAPPSKGDTVKLFGHEYVVSDLISPVGSYADYLEMNGYDELNKMYLSYYDYCYQKVQTENPTMTENEINDLANKLYNETYFEAAEDYYAYADSYLSSTVLSNGYPFFYWVYLNKGIEYAKYFALYDDYYAFALSYRENNGKYPTIEEMDNLLYDGKIIEELKYSLEELYSNEYYSDQNNKNYYFSVAYFLSDEDYFKSTYAIGSSVADAVAVEKIFHYEYGNASNDYSEESVPFPRYYTLVHSNNPEETLEFLRSEFSDTELYMRIDAPFESPASLTEEFLKDQREDMIASLVTLLVFIVVLSLCVYLMMRSALMGRVKEIGIYRAIGVSRKNLIFRFFIETTVLTTLTVFIGYLISGGLISSWISSSTLIAQIFYFPPWLSLSVLILLYGVCTISGLLPILSLLRKTPSEILAKYDI